MAVQNKDAFRRVMSARTAMVLDEPFWGQLSSRLKLKEDPTCPTAWTDGVHIGYNPAFVLELTHAQIIGLMVHETEHCARGHPWRRAGREPKRWNVACDLAINGDVRRGGYQLPSGALFPEQYQMVEHKAAEWYFARLPTSGKSGGSGQGKQPAEQAQQAGGSSEEQGGGGSSQEDDSSDAESAKSEGSEQAKQAGGRGQQPAQDEAGSDEGGSSQAEAPSAPRPEDFGEVRDAPVGVDGDEAPATEEQWTQAVINAAAMAESQGRLPAHMQRVVEEAKRSKVDWASVMMRFAQEAAAADYSWRRPNPRYVYHGTYLPRLDSHQVGVLAVFVDTSGSIDQALLNQFAGVINAIADDVKPRMVRVGYCDAALHRVDEFMQGEPVTFKPVGGGGTDFRPAFAALETWDEPPVCVLYLTDLMGMFPTDPGVPTLWVTPSEQYAKYTKVPFGDVVVSAAS